MLENLPEETTDLLIDICTSLSPLTIEVDEPEATPTAQRSGGASYLSYLALNRASVASTPPPSENAPSTIKPSPADRAEPPHRDPAIQDAPRQGDSPTDTPTASSPTKARPAPTTVTRPSPSVYFAHFVDHTDHFVRFLETVARKRWGQTVENTADPLPVDADPNADADEAAERRDQVAVWNTLFELYLSNRADADKDNAKALALLQNTRLPYDPMHALILCSTRVFTPGLVLLWERMGMHEDVVRFFMDRHREGDADASAEVVRRLGQYGAEGGRAQLTLYPLVLRFLTSTPALLAKHREDVVRVLKVIDEEKIMPPVSVVQVLSRNGVASVGLVKEWLMARIKSAREEVETVCGRPSLCDCDALFLIHGSNRTAWCRTNNSSSPTGWRPKPSCARSRSSQTPTSRACSTSRSARLVRAASTFPLSTSCATTAITSGAYSSPASLLPKFPC